MRELWSERHTGVYHCLDLKKMTSNWILLQLPTAIDNELKQTFEASDRGRIKFQHHLRPHALFHMSFADNWRSYRNFLEDSLMKIVPCRFSE